MFGGPSGKLRSPNQAQFATVPASHMPRSAFDRSHTHKLTGNAGWIIPYLVDEILPGDTVSLQSTIFTRLLTPIVPAMDNLEVKTEFFFVPNRLVWTNWAKMMGEQDNPGDSISYTTPQMTISNWAIHTIGDYLLADPSKNYGGTAGYCSALPFRGYNLIYNQWYRDENINTSVTVDTGDAASTAANYALLKRAKKHDYFYGALTSVQKGPAVPLLSGTANVYGPAASAAGAAAAFQHWNTTDTATRYGAIQKTAGALTFSEGTGWTGDVAGDSTGGINLATAANYTSLGAGFSPPYADFTTDAIDTINTLRLAATTQQFLEKDARAGTRYTEICLSHFGVQNPDARLQRSEYLGGGRADINIQPIPATGFTSGSDHTGDLGGIMTGMSNNHAFTKSFTEHGHLFAMVTLRVKSYTYQQGLRKMWIRQTRYDHYFPIFANLGEQPIYRGEIYYVGDKATTNADNTTVWGYQERWAEYRYFPSKISGAFRSQAASTLDFWHFAQNYGSAPSLNASFLQDDSQTIIDRNLNVTSSATVPQFKMDIYNRYHHARVMPVRSVPGIARL